MIYEAAIRKSLHTGKYMFLLRRDDKTIRVSDARYVSDITAVHAAHNAAFEAHARIGQTRKSAVVFRVRREHAARTEHARTVGPVGLVGQVGKCAEDGARREICGAAMPEVRP